jgi:hypothetical protein
MSLLDHLDGKKIAKFPSFHKEGGRKSDLNFVGQSFPSILREIFLKFLIINIYF